MSDLKPIDVFLDIENIIWGETRAVYLRELDRLCFGLRVHFRACGYEVRTCFAAAAPAPGNREDAYNYRQHLNTIMREHHIEMRWSPAGRVADEMLMHKLRYMLAQDTLADDVAIASGDGDFIPIVDELKRRGRIIHLLSLSRSTSAGLRERADVRHNLITIKNAPA